MNERLHPGRSMTGSAFWSVAVALLILAIYVVRRQQITWPMFLSAAIFMLAGFILLTVARQLGRRIAEIEHTGDAFDDASDD